MYLLYGVVYLAGAIARLSPERQVSINGIPWWVFYALGVLVLIAFPILIWRGYKWFTRILLLGPALKAVTLISRELRMESIDLYNCLFAATAIAASLAMARASWGSQTVEQDQQIHSA